MHETEDLDLTTGAGVRKAITRNDTRIGDVMSTVAKMQKAFGGKLDDANDLNIARALEDLGTVRQELAEIRQDGVNALRAERAAGSDSNVNRYMLPADRLGATTTADTLVKRGEALKTSDDKVLVLRGYHDDEVGYVPGLLDDAPTFEQQKRVQRAFDDYALVRQLRATPGLNGTYDYRDCPQSREALLREIRTLPREAAEPIERAFIDAANKGQEWFDTGYLSTLEREEWRISEVEALFDTINVSKKTTEMPYAGLGAVPYLKARATGDNPPNYRTSDPETDKRTLTTVGFAVHLQVEEDAAEDAYIAVMPFIREDAAAALADGYADCIINGSDAASHPDTLAGWHTEGRWPTTISGGNDDHRKGFVGLRHRARTLTGCSIDQNAPQTAQGMLTLRQTVARPYRTRPNDGVFLTNDEVYLKKILQFDEVLTVDKYGNAATILNGELARVWGSPIMPVGFMTGDLAATGLYTGSGSTAAIMYVVRGRFRKLVRRDVRSDVYRNVLNGMNHVVLTSRKGWHAMGGNVAASEKNVAYGYNWTK